MKTFIIYLLAWLFVATIITYAFVNFIEPEAVYKPYTDDTKAAQEAQFTIYALNEKMQQMQRDKTKN